MIIGISKPDTSIWTCKLKKNSKTNINQPFNAYAVTAEQPFYVDL